MYTCELRWQIASICTVVNKNSRNISSGCMGTPLAQPPCSNCLFQCKLWYSDGLSCRIWSVCQWLSLVLEVVLFQQCRRWRCCTTHAMANTYYFPMHPTGMAPVDWLLVPTFRQIWGWCLASPHPTWASSWLFLYHERLIPKGEWLVCGPSCNEHTVLSCLSLISSCW